MHDLPYPWPRKPPTNARCDLHTGCGKDHLGAPVAFRCKNIAIETVIVGHDFQAQVWVCQECLDSYKGTIIRNPRRKGGPND